MASYIIQLSWTFLTLGFTIWDFSLQLILGFTTACHLVKDTSAIFFNTSSLKQYGKKVSLQKGFSPLSGMAEIYCKLKMSLYPNTGAHSIWTIHALPQE